MRKYFILIFLSFTLFVISSCSTNSATNDASNSILLPTVSNGTELVLDFEGYQVTKAQLYEKMKALNVSILLDTIDRGLLNEFRDIVDYDALEKEIEDDKDYQGDRFYINLTNMGVILGEDDPNAEEKIKEYYLTDYLRLAYAKNVAIKSLEEEINTAYNNYKEDLCIITLAYDTKAKVDQQLSLLKTLQGQAVFDEFDREWRLQHPNGVTNKELPTFLEGAFSCNYERAAFLEYNFDLRDFIFNDDDFNVGDYNELPKLHSGKYIIVYKVSQAPEKSTYSQDLLKKYVTDQLTKNIVDSVYINSKIIELRTARDLKIFDEVLAKQYAVTVPTFAASQNILLDKSTIASYKNAAGEVITISADELYDLIKTKFAVQILLDKLNYIALNTIPEIALTEAERNIYRQKVTQLKEQFLASGYGQYMSWEDYIAAYYGTFSDNELADRFASTELSKRYLLGTATYAGADPVTDQEIQEAYDKWFRIEASHIYISYDNTNLESKLIADVKAHQIIKGFTATKTLFESELANPTSEIKERYYDLYKDLASEKVTEIISTNYITLNNEPFTGLDNTEGSQLDIMFSTLARIYSEDPGSKDKGGGLGYFGPGVMVEPFEQEAKVLASLGSDSFSETPVASIASTTNGDTYGFHVVYVNSYRTKPIKPANYDDIEDPSYSTDAAVKSYYNFINEIKSELVAKHSYAENWAKHLALLLQSKNFSFIDPEIQAQYEAILDIRLAYVRKEN